MAKKLKETHRHTDRLPLVVLSAALQQKTLVREINGALTTNAGYGKWLHVYIINIYIVIISLLI